MTVKELRKWLNDLPDDDNIEIDIDDVIINGRFYGCYAEISGIIKDNFGVWHIYGHDKES